MKGIDKLIEDTAMQVASELNNVVGVDAIVLGGSRAAGNEIMSSNLDIGVYYIGEGVLDVEGLSNILTKLDDMHRTGILAYPGTWGPWLNGGSCIKVNGVIVDITLRNITKVKNIVDETNKGNVTVAYQFGHSFGFVSTMYLAEIDIAKILVDKKRNIAGLKKMIRPMNKNYRKASINNFLWEADYASKTGRRCIERKDIIAASGILYKASMALIQAVYSMNDEYFLNEKGAIDRARRFRKLPGGFIENLESIFIALNKDNIANAFEIIDYYVNDIRNITMGPTY